MFKKNAGGIMKHRIYAIFVLAVALLSFNVSTPAQQQDAGQGKGSPKPGVDHKARQARPIQLGTSGGNAADLANGYCCAGTLGSLIQIGGAQYILSNRHVFAGDSV